MRKEVEMEDHSTNPPPLMTGPPVMKSSKGNGGAFITNCPVWWNPDAMPAQARKVGDYMLTLLPPGNPHNIPGLLPWGDPGTTKTSSSLWVLYNWGMAGKLCAFQDFLELMDKVKACWNRNSPLTPDDVHQKLFKLDLLLLDDVGKRIDPEHQQTLSTIYNGRLNRGKPTILTTNAKLNTDAGREAFAGACDSRVMERLRNCDINMDESASMKNLRKDLHKLEKAKP